MHSRTFLVRVSQEWSSEVYYWVIYSSCSFCKSRPLLSKRKDRNILIELWSQCRKYNYWCVDVGLVSPSERGEVSWQPLSNQNNDILVRTEIRRSAYSPEGRQTNYTLGCRNTNMEIYSRQQPHHITYIQPFVGSYSRAQKKSILFLSPKCICAQLFIKSWAGKMLS